MFLQRPRFFSTCSRNAASTTVQCTVVPLHAMPSGCHRRVVAIAAATTATTTSSIRHLRPSDGRTELGNLLLVGVVQVLCLEYVKRVLTVEHHFIIIEALEVVHHALVVKVGIDDTLLVMAVVGDKVCDLLEVIFRLGGKAASDLSSNARRVDLGRCLANYRHRRLVIGDDIVLVRLVHALATHIRADEVRVICQVRGVLFS
mmetsp:Transcript_58124/g.160935  ORF Transcript_58124/g.160935 Transcript_58124/m.160935 type:complete len:202 (-) Transcript_58124:497-1102(-)